MAAASCVRSGRRARATFELMRPAPAPSAAPACCIPAWMMPCVMSWSCSFLDVWVMISRRCASTSTSVKRCDGLLDDLGAYHRFSGCGRRHDDDALDASRALAVEFGDGFGLVIAELSHRRPCRSRGKRIPALAPEAIVAMTLRGPSSGSVIKPLECAAAISSCSTSAPSSSPPATS